MKKRRIIIIAIVVSLIVSFIIYQLFSSRPSEEIDMIEADIVESTIASSNSSVDWASIEKALGLDVPIYEQIIHNMSHIIASGTDYVFA